MVTSSPGWTGSCLVGAALLLTLGAPGAARAQFMREPPREGSIHRAAYDGDLKTVQRMLAADKGLLEKQYGKYGTPLHTAAGSGHVEITRFLLQRGARADTAKTIGENETALMSASVLYPKQTETQKLAVVRMLVAKGARVRAKDRLLMTALHYAASKGASRIATFLVSKGADINAKTNADMTPLHYAVGYAPMGPDAIQTVRLLLAKGADKKVKFQGQTLVQYAERANRPEMAALLSQAGAK